MIVDIYTHILPDAFFREMSRASPKLENIGARLRGVKKLFDLGLRFAEMDEIGDYAQVISLPNPPLEEIAQVTGAPLSTVKSRLYRGLEALRDRLEGGAEPRVEGRLER